MTTIRISVPAFTGTISFDERVALEGGRAGRHLLPPGAVSGCGYHDRAAQQLRVPYRQPWPYVGFTVRIDGPFVEETGLEVD